MLNLGHFLLRVKGVFYTDLARVTFLNALATIIRMVTGLISVKVVAAVIGPSGVALLGQLNNFTQIVQSISNGGINAGVTKYISEYADSSGMYTRFLGTGFWITLILSFVCSIFLFVGAGYFAEYILHDIKFRSVFYVFGVTIGLYALNAFLISVINGFREYKKYVLVNIVGSVVGLLVSVVMVLNFGIYGALISTVIFQSVVFFISLLIASKSIWFRWERLVSRFDRNVALKLGHYSLMAIVSAVTVPAGQIIVRNFITKYNAIEEAGLWEGINRISGMYLMVVTTSLSVYFLPKISGLNKTRELRAEIFGVYKLIIPFLLTSTFLIYLFRVLIIKLLFSAEFVGMKDLFSFQLVGDMLKILGWVLGYLLLAKAMTKIYVIMELTNFVLLIASSYFLIRAYGSVGATVAFCIVYLIYLLILLVVFRKMLFGRTSKD